MKGAEIIMAAILATSATGASAQPKPPEAQAARKFDAGKVIGEVRQLIAQKYVLPELRPALDKALADGLATGRYATDEPGLFAERVNADLARVGRDHHLNFGYAPQNVAMMMARTADDKPDPAAFEAEVRRHNHGVTQLRLLPGNVRYMELAGFDWMGEESETVLNSAMAFLKGGDAVVIDLRRNGGGAGRAVHQLISHFVRPTSR